MKSLFLSAALMLGVFAASASDTKESRVLSYQANQNLIMQFGEVKNVSWKYAKNGMIRADFSVEDESVTAFFKGNGDFIASTRDVTKQQLPLKLRLAVSNRIGDTPITNMFELNSAEEHAYYIEVEKNGKKKLYKGYDYGSLVPWTIEN